MEELQRLVVNAIGDGAFPGAAWEVWRDDNLVDHGAAGQAVVLPCAQSMELTTWFDLASLTKVVTSILVLQQVEAGSLTLDDQASRWFAKLKNDGAQPITIRDLLTHTSGILGQQRLFHMVTGRNAMLEAVTALPRNPPGQEVVYLSQGFIILGAIVEEVTGRRLDELVEQQVNAVLETCFQFNPNSELKHHIAATEDRPDRGIVWGEVHDGNAFAMDGIAGHAGLFGRVTDVAALGRAMLDECNPLLSPASKRAMTRNWTSHLGAGRGLGWQMGGSYGSPAGDLLGPRTFGHTGFTGTSLFCDPEQHIVAVLLTNRVHPSRENLRIHRFRRQFHNAVAGVASRVSGSSLGVSEATS